MPHSAINCKKLVPKCAWRLLEKCSWIWSSWGRLFYYDELKTTTDLAKCTSCRTCKRKFSQDHINPVTETEGVSRLHPLYISSDLQEELLTGSCQRSYWTDRGSQSSSTYISSDLQEELLTAQIMPAQLLNRQRISVFIHVHLVGPTRGNFSQDYCQRSYWTDRGSHLYPYPRNGHLGKLSKFFNHDFE